MGLILFSCRGGAIALPARGPALVGREDGGNLIVNPLRPVWERSELEADELAAWTFLVAATTRAIARAESAVGPRAPARLSTRCFNS